MTPTALQALIAKWREQAETHGETSERASLGESYRAMSKHFEQVLNECADDLETALAWIGEGSASSPQIAELRVDLWRLAGTIVATCDSGSVNLAQLACMEGSPLVGEAREIIAKHGLSNKTIVDAITGEVREGSASASPWLPIDTAPKGTWLDGPNDTRDPAYVEPPRLWLTLDDGRRCVGYADAYYAEGGSGYDGEPPWVEEFSGERIKPTHWMPLPSPPGEKSDDKERP